MLRKIKKKNNKQTIILQRIAVSAIGTRLRENSRPAPDQCFRINSQTDYTIRDHVWSRTDRRRSLYIYYYYYY